MRMTKSRNGEGQKPTYDLTRSPRVVEGSRISSGTFNDGVPVIKGEEDVEDSQNHYVLEKRVRRNSDRAKKCVNNHVNGFDSEKGIKVLPKEGKIEHGFNFCNQSGGRIERSIARSSNRVKMKPDGSLNLKSNVGKSDVQECEIERENEDENCKRKEQIGEENCGIDRSWSREQDLALQGAYFSVKPSPQFWNKVARMVPGKSAKECFDRIQSDDLTPSQPRTASRAKIKEPSLPLFSASKLLAPVETKAKGIRPSRTLVLRKTVRQILQEHHSKDKNYEPDLFSVLEPTVDLSSFTFQEGTESTTPALQQGFSILASCSEVLLSPDKKHSSRLNSSKDSGFVSPPVLKPMKNKCLHEKYIDQLHLREAKRKAESLRSAERIHSENDQRGSHAKVKLVKAANALVLDAQLAIHQFQIKNNNLANADDDNANYSSGDEDEEVLCETSPCD